MSFSGSLFNIIDPLPPNEGGFFYATLNEDEQGVMSMDVSVSNETEQYKLTMNLYDNSLSVFKSLEPNSAAFIESNFEVPMSYNSTPS